MNILISGLSRFTSPTGICRYVSGLAKSLNAQPGVSRVTCVVGSWQLAYYDRVLGLGALSNVDVFPVEIRNTSLGRNLWFLTELPGVARRTGADLVHWSFPIPVSGRNYGAKTVVTIHDLYPFDFPFNVGYPKVLFSRSLLRRSVASSDGVSSVSATTLARLRELIPSAKSKPVAVIPNVVAFADTGSLRPDWMRDSDKFVLVVAQHRRNKNLPLAITGFRRMREKRVLPSDSKLVIVGSHGPETRAILGSIRLGGLGDSVRLASSIGDCELRWLYEHCLLFLATSAIEGFCVPLLEAMYFGCRIVCSDIETLREIGSSNCHYFEVEKSPVASLMAACESALAASAPARSFCHTKYSSRAVGEQYLALYSEVLGLGKTQREKLLQP
jgi:glycosyltransferase involved in cell wall biosynthesis